MKNKNKNNINLILVRLYRKSAKYNLELNTDLKEIITGLMLGDLFAEKRNPNSNTRLQFKQSIKNKVYIDYLYSIFKEYCNSEPKETSSLDKQVKKNLMFLLNFGLKVFLVLINLESYFTAQTSQVKKLYL